VLTNYINTSVYTTYFLARNYWTINVIPVVFFY